MEMGTVIHKALSSTISPALKPETSIPHSEIDEPKCPSCGYDAVYKYGKAWTGKRRFLCKMCGKQFTESLGRATVKDRPLCGECGSHMNLYKTDGNMIRFRCSHYPACRTFKKFIICQGRVFMPEE